MDELHPLNPSNPYAAAKTGADRLVFSYVTAYDIPGIIIRPFNTYGPKQHLEKVIPRFITSCILGEPLTIHGQGAAARDWLFVEDTIKSIENVMVAPIEKVKGEVFNIGSGRSLSVFEIADKIVSEFGIGQKFEFLPERPGQVNKHLSSTEKAEKILGFRSAVSFEQGIKKTIQWYKENTHLWEKQLPLRHVPVKNRDGTVVLW